MNNRNGQVTRNIGSLSYEITRQYPGQHIVYSEDEKRVIGAGDTLEEAFERAEASGVKGLWHFGYGELPDVYQV